MHAYREVLDRELHVVAATKLHIYYIFGKQSVIQFKYLEFSFCFFFQVIR